MKKTLLIFFLLVLSLKGICQSCTLSVGISSSSPAICSESMVTLTADVSNGTPAYKYVWNTGETTPSINVNKAGTYTVTVSDNTPGCQPVNQQITLTNSTTPAVPTAADALTCPNGTATLTATAPGGIYQWYDASVGGNLLATGASFTTPPLNSNTTYYVETTVSACTSLRKAVNVNIINSLIVNGTTICSGNTATLTASGATSYEWYDSPSGGNILSTNSSFTTPVLTTTTSYFVVATANGCVSNRTPVTAIVYSTPTPPIVSNVTICSGSTANLSASSSSPGVVYDWFDVPNGGTSLITSPEYTTPPLTATKTYYVQTSNVCVSTRTPVTVTVNPIPQAPAVNSITICSGTGGTLTATAPGGTYQWFDSAFSTTALTTGDTFQTPVLTNTTTYYVEATNGGCVSVRTAVTVTVSPIPPTPSAPGQIICSGNTATLTATAQQGTFEWYDAPTGGNLLSGSASYTTLPLTVNTTYYVQSIVSGCVSARTPVQVSVLPIPQPPTAANVTICAGNNATLTESGSYSGFEWYDAATGGNLLSSSLAYVTPALAITTTYYVQGLSNGCASTRTPVTVTVNSNPAPPTASGTTVCQGTSTTLTASAAGGSFEWYDAATGGNLLASGSTFNTPALTANTIFYVQNTSGQCSSTRTAVTVTVTPIANPEFQYPSGTFCSSGSNPTPVISNPNGGTFSASPAGLVFVSTSTGQINVSASALGNYTIFFASNGTCPNTSSAKIAIVSIPNAQFSYSGPYCQNGTNPLPAFPAGASAGIFSASSGGLTFTNTSTGEINLSNSNNGTYTITNTIAANGGCPASVFTGTVTIYQVPTVYAGPNQTVASGSTVQLAGSSTGASGVLWSGGLGPFSNTSNPNAVYTPAAGETTVTLTLTANAPPGPCGPQSSQVTIQIQPTPNVPVAAGTTVCSGSVATLIATAPGGTYSWYDAATGGNLLATNSIYNTSPLTITTTYYVQTTVNGITSARTPVTVTVNAIPASPVAPADTVCVNNTATLTVTGSTGSYQWYDAATGGNLLSTNNSYITQALLINTSYFVQTTVNGCVSPRTQVNVVVNPIPAITSSNTGNICSGTALNYIITSDIANSAFSWSRAAVANINNTGVSNQTLGTINETLINTGNTPVDVTYIITPSANKCTGVPFNLVITVYPTATVTSASTQTICSGTSANYNITFNTPVISFSWSRAAVNGISNLAVFNQAADTIREILTNTSNTPIDVKYVFTINTNGCSASTFTYVVTVNPIALITSASTSSICSGVAQNYIIRSNIPSATFIWGRDAVPNISNPALLNQSSGIINEVLINTSSNPVEVIYYITPLVNGCAGSEIAYVVTVNPQPATPVANSNSPVCLNSTIKLNTIIVSGAAYLWKGPNGFSSVLQNPSINYVTKANSGTYSLTITTGGCASAVATVNVSVDDFPIANAGLNLVVCANTPGVPLNGKISGGTTTGIWTSSGTGTFSPASNQLDAQYIPSAQDISAGNVTLTLNSTSKDDCNIATSNMIITFQAAPIANAGGNQDVCSQDVSVKLNGQAQFASGVVWTTSGTGTFSPSANQLAPAYIPSGADIKNGSVNLTFQANGTSCNNTADQITIRFIPPPTVDAGKERALIKGQTLVLTPTVSDENVQYLWTPNININDNTIKNPTIKGVTDMVYTLRVIDSRGCISESQVFIKVLPPVIVVNTFTPNGDGINDKWDIPALLKYPGATVDIFTRNGQKIFHSIGYGISWDGTYNGKQVPFGVYYYIIDTKFEGQVLSGYLTIIR